MTFVITQPCIDVRDQSCVEVCPVDCIHYEDDDRMLYIDPTVCIDCGACEPACPVTAIYAESDVPADQLPFTEINALWFTDASAARAKVVDIPALEGAAEAAASAAGGDSSADAAPAEATAPPASSAADAAPAATAEAPTEPEGTVGAYKLGENGIEGKCALCGQYVIKGGTMVRRKSVLCPDCAGRGERMRNPYGKLAGRR